MRILNLTLALLATVTITGCASGLGGGDYQRAEARRVISVRMGDLDGFRRYISWCEEGEAGASALCQRWAARARHEYGGVNPLRALSPAEMRVWGLLKGRLTLSEIADALFLSRETVKTHTMSIYRKLGVSSRREAQDLADSWE